MKDNKAHLQSTIVEELRQLLDQYNPYVKNYRFVRDRVSCNSVQDLKFRIIGKRNRDPRRYNVPSTSEVAALIVGDIDTSHHDRDIIVETQGGRLKRISTLSSAYLPLQYPLLFARGEDGWCGTIEYNDSLSHTAIKREHVTLRE